MPSLCIVTQIARCRVTVAAEFVLWQRESNQGHSVFLSHYINPFIWELALILSLLILKWHDVHLAKKLNSTSDATKDELFAFVNKNPT